MSNSQPLPTYKKSKSLVRDNYPSKIFKTGRIPIVRNLSKKEFKTYLKSQLVSESMNLLSSTKSGLVENLAEIMEILNKIIEVEKIDIDIIQKLQFDKYKAMGSFDKMYLLEHLV